MTLFEIGTFETYRVKETAELFADLGQKGAQLENYSCFSDFADSLPPAKRKLVYSAVELYKRMNVERDERKKITSSEDIFSVMKPLLCDLPNEEVWIIYLNHSCKIISKKRISVGGMTETAVDVRLLLKHAILQNATVIAMVHNHPSGNRNPSSEDRRLTEKLAQACKMMNIHLLDHVIIAGNSYYSFRDEGLF